MKYTRLTKEQFKELYQEFANFLASQNIDKAEWEQIKSETPEIAEQELDVFSDLIWEGALNKVEYLEHFSKNHIFLFRFNQNTAQSIIIQSNNSTVDFLSKEGIVWLSENISSEQIDIRQGKKSFDDKNTAAFSIIQQGALISDGSLYKQIKSVLGI